MVIARGIWASKGRSTRATGEKAVDVIDASAPLGGADLEAGRSNDEGHLFTPFVGCE